MFELRPYSHRNSQISGFNPFREMEELENAFSKRVISLEDGRVISDRTGGYYGHEA